MDTSSLIDPTNVTTLTLVTIAMIMAVVTVSDRLLNRLAHGILRLVVHVPDDHLLASTVRWWRRRLLGLASGVLIGTVVSTGLVWWFGMNRGGPVVDLIVVGAMAGGIVGAAAQGVPVSRQGPHSENMARSRMLRLSDFTPAWLRYFARSAVVLAVLMTFATMMAAMISPRGGGLSINLFLSPSSILAILGLAALVRFEISGRRIVQRSTSAHSEGDLANDSILRCLAVRDLAQAAALVGVVSSLFALPGLALAVDSSLPTPDNVQGFTIAVAVLACIGASIAIFGPARIRPPMETAPRRLQNVGQSS
ncbi:hypothetical protein [Cryobacterium sp. MLB-32]|uniref:hypothetical protein n=1 Tax=Cryobacterium sp. MLB-32 TaxID=1529318 RepID=UPI0005625998|nr:hypothetical protein [Cryobacterium sp. MLB-32]